MKVAIDISPVSKELPQSGHKVRGAGMYIEGLMNALKKDKDDNSYTFFDRTEKVYKDAELIHYPYFEPFFRSLSILHRKKTVVTVHDLIPLIFPEHFPAGIRGKFSWQMQKFALKKANAIITDSYCSKKDIEKIAKIDQRKIYVVYLAAAEVFKKISDRNALERVREKYSLPKEFVLYVGDATWNKNLPNLIRATKKLDINLVMVGKALSEANYDRLNLWNADRVEIERLVEGDDKIQRLGFLPQDDLVAVYNLAKLFVMPSHYEGFGLPILEAMQSGCPVVCTDKGSLKEVAGNASLFIEPGEESIKDGIKEVWDNERLRSKLSKKGLENAKKFSWEKTAKDTINIYKKVINEN